MTDLRSAGCQRSMHRQHKECRQSATDKNLHNAATNKGAEIPPPSIHGFACDGNASVGPPSMGRGVRRTLDASTTQVDAGEEEEAHHVEEEIIPDRQLATQVLRRR